MRISKRIGIHRLLHSHKWPEIDRWIRTCHLSRHKVPMEKYKECYESLLEHFPRQSVLRIKFDLWYCKEKWHLSLLHGRNYPGANPRRGDSAHTVPWSTDFRNGGAGPLAGLGRREIRNGMEYHLEPMEKRSGGNPQIPHLQVPA